MMEDAYVNVENDTSVKTRPLTTEPGPRSSERSRHGPVILGLVLLSVLLLARIICLSVHYHDAAAELSTIKANLTDLTEERNQLETNITEMQKLLKQETCPAGWQMFSCSCYFLSSQSGPWTGARDDCRSREAHLVVIDSSKEQVQHNVQAVARGGQRKPWGFYVVTHIEMFLSGFTKQAAWIGLSDRDKEGTWTWINGTPLTSTSPQFWWTGQPDNRGPTENEDCGEIRAGTALWNDLRCDASRQWICEKVQ